MNNVNTSKEGTEIESEDVEKSRLIPAEADPIDMTVQQVLDSGLPIGYIDWKE